MNYRLKKKFVINAKKVKKVIDFRKNSDIIFLGKYKKFLELINFIKKIIKIYIFIIFY